MEHGRYDQAADLLKEAAEARRARFGPDSPLTARTDEMLARLMRMQGRLDEAEASLTSVLGRRQALRRDPIPIPSPSPTYILLGRYIPSRRSATRPRTTTTLPTTRRRSPRQVIV